MLIVDANYSQHVSKTIGKLDIRLLLDYMKAAGYKFNKKVWVTSYVDNQKFLTFIKSFSGGAFEVIIKGTKEKRFICNSCYKENYSTIEKGNDVEIATQIVSHAYKNTYDTLYLFSGDGDYLPALKIVNDLKKKIVLIGLKHLTSTDIVYLCDEFIDLSEISGITR